MYTLHIVCVICVVWNVQKFDMRLHVYRREAVQPDGIVAMAVRDKEAAVVLESGVLEMYTVPDLTQIRRIDIGTIDVQSMAYDNNELLIASLSKGAMLVCLNSYRVKRSTEEGAWRVCTERNDVLWIYSVVGGGAEVRVNNKVVYECKDAIFALCKGQMDGEVCIGAARGRVMVVKEGRVVADIKLTRESVYANMCMYTRKERERYRKLQHEDIAITDILRMHGPEYAVATQSGEIFIVDTEIECIRQIIQVRESSINALCVVDSRIYATGADSRIIAYAKASSGQYTKHSQHDMHIADVWCMKMINRTIITGGLDGMINTYQINEMGEVVNTKRRQKNEAKVTRCTYATRMR